MEFLTKIFICLLCLLLLVNIQRPVSARQSSTRQEALSLSQIERLIKNRTPDNAVAVHIRKKGIKFRPDEETFNQLRRMGAGLKTIQALRVASEEKKGALMTSNAAKPKLWITYAWDNNKGGDFDFLVQELKAAGVNVTFDKVALIPGQRLWQQIAEKIEDPDLANVRTHCVKSSVG